MLFVLVLSVELHFERRHFADVNYSAGDSGN